LSLAIRFAIDDVLLPLGAGGPGGGFNVPATALFASNEPATTPTPASIVRRSMFFVFM
jgi:hypothetical protein